MPGLPHLASLQDIEGFGRQVAARSLLPVLVRRIISQSNDSVTVLRMAGEEDVDLPGYDGVVSANRGTAFVPDGRSVWEFGVAEGAKTKAKAQEDYDKRSADPLGEDPSVTTFVFVTPHRWAGSEDWAREKRAEGTWADVRVHTSNDILTALEETPAAHMWFSEYLGKPATGAESLESWWGRFQGPTKGLLTPELVLSGRDDASAQLLRILTDQDSSHLWIRAATPDDVLAFVAAALVANGRATQDDLLARAIVVYDPGVLRYLDRTTDLLILVPFNESLVREADLVSGHHVILMTTDAGTAAIDLPSIPIQSAQALLSGRSLPDATAREYAKAAFRSIPLLRSTIGGVTLPNSALSKDDAATARIVRRAWFVGRWNSNRPGDMDILNSITGASSDEIAAALVSHTTGADPIFSKVGNGWAVISPVASASRLAPTITADDLNAVESVVQGVLGSVDPALELPAKDRWTAALYGKSREHSSDLRGGVATSLALFGSLDTPIADQTSTTLQGWAAQIVRALLQRANDDTTGDLWLSIVDLLPKLAEAAPSQAVSLIRAALQPSGSLRPRVFTSSSDFFARTSPHVYVGWALERLAWSSEHFGSAVQLLVLLASIDPGGKLSNRPINSLTSILRVWRPQTSASRADRNGAVRSAARRTPAVAGPLAISLIPEAHEFTGETAAPEFRAWKTDVQVTTPEMLDDLKFYASLAVELAAVDRSLWIELIPKLPDLLPSMRKDLLDQLVGQARGIGEIEDAIWTALTDLVRRHEQFPDADWSLPDDELDALRDGATALEPGDVAVRVQWLFSNWPDIGISVSDTEQYQSALLDAQMQAVVDVFDVGGLADVVWLAKRVDSPWTLGYAFGCVNVDVPALEIAVLFDDEDRKVRSFASAVVSFKCVNKTDELVALATELEASATAKARVLLMGEALETIWGLLDSFGQDVENAYWQEFIGFGRGGDFSLVNESARGLADHGRIAAALDLLAIYANRGSDPVDAELVADLLNRLLVADDPETRSLSEYDFEQLLQVLRDSPAVTDDVVATLEWSLLPALSQQADSLTLQRQLAEHPSFFVDVVSMVYRPRSGEEPDLGRPKTTKDQANNAWRLLSAWKVPPGLDRETGQIDPAVLGAWVDEARALLLERDRQDVGDSQIGQVLAHAPLGDDDQWPCEPVRNLIEDLSAEHINSGFAMGVRNKRGMVSRGLEDGGAQEYRLEEQYGAWAQALSAEWPQTAELLRAVARSYHDEGKRNDEEAQRFREGLDD